MGVAHRIHIYVRVWCSALAVRNNMSLDQGQPCVKNSTFIYRIKKTLEFDT